MVDVRISIYEAAFIFGSGAYIVSWIVYKALTTKPLDSNGGQNHLEKMASKQPIPLKENIKRLYNQR